LQYSKLIAGITFGHARLLHRGFGLVTGAVRYLRVEFTPGSSKITYVQQAPCSLRCSAIMTCIAAPATETKMATVAAGMAGVMITTIAAGATETKMATLGAGETGTTMMTTDDR
jgi:hypothetical protein